MIVFIPRSAGESKPQKDKSEWLPQPCPACGIGTVIGHGRRWRCAHDQVHDKIRIRRGLCQNCRKTFTVLPAWCVPGALYSLNARQHALAQLAAGEPVKEAAPDCKDPDRIIDPSTVRRWFWRRLESLRFLLSPTLLAWDFRAAARILFPEGFSP